MVKERKKVTRSVFLMSLVPGQRMKREVKKDEAGNEGFLRETAVAWSLCCCKLGEGESKDSKKESGKSQASQRYRKSMEGDQQPVFQREAGGGEGPIGWAEAYETGEGQFARTSNISREDGSQGISPHPIPSHPTPPQPTPPYPTLPYPILTHVLSFQIKKKKKNQTWR